MNENNQDTEFLNENQIVMFQSDSQSVSSNSVQNLPEILSDGYGVSVELRVREKAPPAESTSDSTVGQSSAGEACERRGRGRRAATTVSPHQALEVSAGRAAAALRARDGAGRVLGSRAEPLTVTGKALPTSDAAPAAPAGPATAAADALQRAREDRDRLIRDLKRR
ncbi:hypothetical protein MSG28_001440 [Choristoneura fumiferana]|uniref:Uncharacterized protein n=1 Tax=Choristoneura fumiferana TaxID=7141 RepID=A0ACC0KU59_CHOFU|nr:hypothetical protein MSG28_001440 [Choristoneura fumiferana]